MPFRLGVAVLIVLLLQLRPPLAQAQYSYWWCVGSNAGYPWVRTCATPWRLVTPNSTTPQVQTPSYQAKPPAPASLSNPTAGGDEPAQLPITASPTPPPSEAFREGQADRRDWEAWFDQQSGDYRAGAEWWAGERSLPTRRSCAAASPSAGTDWTAGCFAAEEKLTPSDVRRKTEPQYRLGWNNLAPAASSPMATEDAGTAATRAQTAAPSATPTLVPTTSNSPSTTPQSNSFSEQPSAAASPVVAPVASQLSSENQTPIVPQASGEGWVIGIAFVVGGWVVLRRYKAKRRRDDALRIAAAEIDSHSTILHVKRLQTVLPDAYGTVFLDKWRKEKDYYIQTRILPTLRANGLDVVYGVLAVKIDMIIEEAAQRSISPTFDIASRFISNPEIFDARMEPIDYEKHCALQLEKAGWGTRLTATTGDQGADVIADRAGKVLVLQCKLYSSTVGNDAVQQVIAARQFQSADLAAVASNQRFTRSAKQLAGVSGVHLLHHEQLASFIG